jgi:hypothetical protein
VTKDLKAEESALCDMVEKLRQTIDKLKEKICYSSEPL